MNPSEFWQNFKLGQEQEIAAGFIYDGLRQLHELENLNSNTEIFPILYNLAIGFERLLKVVINLIEFDESIDEVKFQKKLKIHKHLNLFNRINIIKDLDLTDKHKDFLKLLSDFYNLQRYDRLTFDYFDSTKGSSKDVESFLNFLKKNIDIDLTHRDLMGVRNSLEIKILIGGLTRDIVKKMREIILEQSGSKNIYTYEISSSSSKAAKIFYGDEPYTFNIEDRAIIELIIYLVNLSEEDTIELIREIDPVDFDDALMSNTIKAILYKNPRNMQSIIDAIEFNDDESGKNKDRDEQIDYLINM